ncbi:6-phosphogluconolactonase [Roseisolibacter agri]|uniref:6-phosphogluconolactonase n=1 Tax=Roseisolibacter agri TaxID=2014610 RepID=A0AA37V9W4_9BACT|nr:6-phosphogluconolactonase [Roseisolibacter agri]GLC24823.1 6-phosphogluconolactonase [Roseisolibacter agri]
MSAPHDQRIRPELVVLADADAVADEAATRVAAAMREAVAARGQCVLALSGGSTPRRLHARLVAMGAEALPWAQTYIVFGDERCVPPDDSASNFGMARETLLAHVPVPDAQVLRMEGERPPADGAERYEATLRALATRLGVAEEDALFDVVLLGMGADGHTASLFPGDAALDETTRWVLDVCAPATYAPRDRLTLTLPALSRARTVLVLAGGAEKRDAVAHALRGDADARETLPVARVRGRARTTWLLDRVAAGHA